MHANEGQLIAYLDGELGVAPQREIEAHIEACPACQVKLKSVEERRGRALSLLAAIDGRSRPSPASISAARARLQDRIQTQEQGSMFKKIFAPRYGRAWALAGLVLILAVAMAFQPVRAIANSFLGLFRVQQFTVVQVNPANLPEQLGSSSQLESMLSTDVIIQEMGEPQQMGSPEEAESLSGIDVRLPSTLTDTPQIWLTPGAHAELSIDMDHVNAVLAEIGREDIQLPASLEGAQVSVEALSGVSARYGDCEFNPESARQDGTDPDNPRVPRLPQCTTLLQVPSPAVEAPAGLDITRIGEAFLQVLGMPADEAARFAKNIDWTTTFVIPIPRYGTSYQEVQVDGVSGTFIRQDLQDHTDQYMLLWVKDEVVYALTGPGNLRTALEIASSLE